MSRAEIYHFTMTTGRVTGINKLRPVVISVNAFLGAAFIVLAALFYNLSDTRVINCSTPATQELTDAEKVAIAYKVIFALICLGLAVTFGIYGGRIIEMMQQTAKMAGRTRNSDRNKALTRVRTWTLCDTCQNKTTNSFVFSLLLFPLFVPFVC
jgi:predicted outer membrane lipoprotein